MEIKIKFWNRIETRDLLFAYKSVKYNTTYIIVNSPIKNTSNVCYNVMNKLDDNIKHLYDNTSDPNIMSEYINQQNISSNYAFFLGTDSSINIENGLLVDPGDEFIGWNNTNKIRLSVDEIELLCSITHNHINDNSIESLIRDNDIKVKDNNYAT